MPWLEVKTLHLSKYNPYCQMNDTKCNKFMKLLREQLPVPNYLSSNCMIMFTRYIIQVKSEEVKVDTLVWFKILQNQMIIAAQNMKVA